MYEIMVIILTFLMVALSCWWLDDFDEVVDESLSKGEQKSTPYPREQTSHK